MDLTHSPWDRTPSIWPQSIGVTWVTVVAAVFFVLTANNSLWQSLAQAAHITATENLGFAGAVFVFLTAAFTLVISLFGFKYLFKPMLVLLFLVAAASGYFMDTYGAVIDSGMLQNTLETDPAEAQGLLSLEFLWRLLWAGALPIFIVWRLPIHYRSLPKQLLSRACTVVVAGLVVFTAAYSHYKDFTLVGRANHSLRYLVNPTYPVYAAGQLVAGKFHVEDTSVTPLGADAAQAYFASGNRTKRLVVFVVGETARSANFSLDGYARDTNPKIKRQDIIYFKNVSSYGTATAVSLPCMFSRMDRRNYDDFEAKHTENLLDVLTHAGVQVLWRDNNSGCKGVCERVDSLDTSKLDVPEYCATGECFDEILLHQLQDWVDSSIGDAFIVLHQQGSHGPEYYKRYPEEFHRFEPECRSNRPQDCTREEIVNAYDNSILYTDYFLSKVIGFLQKQPSRIASAMVYMSDHGESLGENGLYLHGFPYVMAPQVQTEVPLLAWFSPAFTKSEQVDRACIKRSSGAEYSHDNVFDSVLGLFRVRTTVYQQTKDIFASCRGSGQLVMRGKLTSK